MGRKTQQGSSNTAPAARESGKGRERQREVREKQREVREEGKKKEKQKQKEVMEEGRTKEKRKDGKEGEPKGAGQRFFKVFFPEQSGERLKIPPPFHQYLEDKPSGLVSLKGPSGSTWQMLLTSDSEGLYLTQGWKEFARDHSLKQGHFLVFTYDGDSQFSVVVFCASGVEDKSALVAQPCNDKVVKVENDEGDLITDAGGTSEVSAVPLEEVNGTTGKRTRGMDDLIANGAATKRKKAKKKRPEAIAGTSNTNKVSLLDELNSSNNTRIRDKDVPRSGTFILKKVRQPVVISQRRPVTEEEKNLALKMAKAFKSRNPFAMQIMMDSYVYVGFFMNISCEFVRESLPKTNKKISGIHKERPGKLTMFTTVTAALPLSAVAGVNFP